MAETLLPSGVATQGDWTGSAADVDEGVATHDSDATTVAGGGTPVNPITFDFANTTLTGDITSCVIKLADRFSGVIGSDLTVTLLLESTELESVEFACAGTYTERSWSPAWPPSGYGSVTPAQINTLQIKLDCDNQDAADVCLVTALEAEISDDAVAGADTFAGALAAGFEVPDDGEHVVGYG